VLADLLDVVLPSACAGCQGPRSGSWSRLCETCTARCPSQLWPLSVAGLDQAWGWAPYDGVHGAALRRGKYRPDPSTLAELGGHLASVSRGLAAHVDVVVPVPRSWRSLLATGLEPAGLLAQPVARAARRPVSRVLRRRPGPAQAALSDDRRQTNVRGVFRAVASVSRQRVLLVDDVVTTGATARACAAVLRDAGAERVLLLGACSPAL